MVIELDLTTTTTKRGGTCCVAESNGQDKTDVETDIGIDDVLRFDNANFSSVVSESQSKSLLPKSGSVNEHYKNRKVKMKIKNTYFSLSMQNHYQTKCTIFTFTFKNCNKSLISNLFIKIVDFLPWFLPR